MFTEEQKAEIAKQIEEATAGLKAKNAELIEDNKKWKAEARKASEIKPEDLAALENENEKLRGELTTAQKAVKDAATRAEKAEKTLETESGFTRKLLVENGLKDTLIKGGVKDEDFLDALVTKFSQGAQIVVEGDLRKAMLGDKELSAVVSEYLATDAGKKFVAAPNNGGGGAGGGNGGGGGKTMPRDQFAQLGAAEQAEFIKGGGKPVDAGA